MTTPLNKYISQAGVCSRRKAVDLIKEGKVKVNGKTVKKPYYGVTEDDSVTANGRIVIPEAKIYILLNKPKGYITTTSDERGRRTVLDLIRGIKAKLFPVGRLDRDTTGVLLLTNDGNLAQRLSHPKYEIEKVYHVTLDKSLDKFHFMAIRRGLRLYDGIIKVDSIQQQKNSRKVILSLHSGKNRIVRRIFEHFNYTVKALDRIRYSDLTYRGIPQGRWKQLKPHKMKI